MKLPPKKIIREFFLIYDSGDVQTAVNFLTKYYGVRRLKIIVDGRRVSKGYKAEYYDNKAYFTKKGLTKRNVLHEFYHHIREQVEEKEARRFAREMLKRR